YGDHLGDAQVFADIDFDTGVISLDQGYVYTRIFGSLNPIAGDYYFASEVADPSFRTEPAGPPTSIVMNTDLVLGNELNRLIVPEPSVLAFLGLSGLLMAVRRRLK
ncbi:MAG: PEP-CTERM sorting domain-containing protein, partial [Kiritimatiellae bacterium]|nr:PEP-CTERM sorting domain-containing protein [Kiritimatiellia bacterium]